MHLRPHNTNTTDLTYSTKQNNMTTPQETTILSTFLLSRASLPSILTLPQFTALFPKPYQKHPHIPLLYAELSLARQRTSDRVRRNIGIETKLGARQRRAVQRQRAEERARDEAEALAGMDMGETSFDERQLSLAAVLAQLEKAEAQLGAEREMLESETARMLAEINGVLDDMSDLRKGKFGGVDGGLTEGGLEGATVEALRGLVEACEE